MFDLLLMDFAYLIKQLASNCNVLAQAILSKFMEIEVSRTLVCWIDLDGVIRIGLFSILVEKMKRVTSIDQMDLSEDLTSIDCVTKNVRE